MTNLTHILLFPKELRAANRSLQHTLWSNHLVLSPCLTGLPVHTFRLQVAIGLPFFSIHGDSNQKPFSSPSPLFEGTCDQHITIFFTVFSSLVGSDLF